MQLTKEQVLRDIDMLPKPYKTADIDRLIRAYIKEKADSSLLRPYVLTHQELHRIYYYVALKQMKDVNARMQFIHENLLFEDWWHTDELINFVNNLDFNVALRYATEYVASDDPFTRRWGYVMFISSLGRGRAAAILPLIHDDEHYYVQMAEAWLICELAIFEPDYVYEWLSVCGLNYNISGKAIQKICDSFRVPPIWKEKYKDLRKRWKQNKERYMVMKF